jgi:hypothetical protein
VAAAIIFKQLPKHFLWQKFIKKRYIQMEAFIEVALPRN